MNEPNDNPAVQPNPHASDTIDGADAYVEIEDNEGGEGEGEGEDDDTPNDEDTVTPGAPPEGPTSPNMGD